MTVRELLSRIDSEELSEWLAYDRHVEPLPDGYWQAGVIASTVANAIPGSKKRFRPEDFVPRKGPRPVQSAAEGMTRFNLVVAGSNLNKGA